jgi:hypothetical protein
MFFSTDVSLLNAFLIVFSSTEAIVAANIFLLSINVPLLQQDDYDKNFLCLLAPLVWWWWNGSGQLKLISPSLTHKYTYRRNLASSLLNDFEYCREGSVDLQTSGIYLLGLTVPYLKTIEWEIRKK